jgi:SAM-dependent methyltransferase
VEPDEELWDLQQLAQARRLTNWMFQQFEPHVHGRVAEIGAGIGTFSERLLATPGVDELLLVEPEPVCADHLEARFGGHARVRFTRDPLPHPEALRHGAPRFDLVLCQNVLEHVRDDQAAVDSMAKALVPGGVLSLLVPAHPRLFGRLDTRYGHWRRYDRRRVRALFAGAGLHLEELYSFNLLGVPGWWLQGRRRSPAIGAHALRAFEMLVPVWRPIEQRLRLPWGLSLIARGRRLDAGA